MNQRFLKMFKCSIEMKYQQQLQVLPGLVVNDQMLNAHINKLFKDLLIIILLDLQLCHIIKIGSLAQTNIVLETAFQKHN